MDYRLHEQPTFWEPHKSELLALIHGLHIVIANGLTPLEINIDWKDFIGIIHKDHPTLT